MAVIASDDFTRADNASNWGTATGSGGGSLYTWSRVQGSGSWQIKSNLGVFGTATYAVFLLGSATQGDTEGLIKFWMNSSTSIASVLLRAGASGNTGYIAYMNSGHLDLGYLNSTTTPTISNFVSVTLTYAAYIWIRFRVTGSSSPVLQARAWNDGNAEPGSWQNTFTDTGNHFTAAGRYGVWCHPTSTTLDGCANYSVNAIASIGAPQAQVAFKTRETRGATRAQGSYKVADTRLLVRGTAPFKTRETHLLTQENALFKARETRLVTRDSASFKLRMGGLASRTQATFKARWSAAKTQAQVAFKTSETRETTRAQDSFKVAESRLLARGIASFKARETHFGTGGRSTFKMRFTGLLARGTALFKTREARLAQHGQIAFKTRFTGLLARGITLFKVRETRLYTRDSVPFKIRESRFAQHGQTTFKARFTGLLAHGTALFKLRMGGLASRTQTSFKIRELRGASRARSSFTTRESRLAQHGQTSFKMRSAGLLARVIVPFNMRESRLGTSGHSVFKMRFIGLLTHGIASFKARETHFGTGGRSTFKTRWTTLVTGARTLFQVIGGAVLSSLKSFIVFPLPTPSGFAGPSSTLPLGSASSSTPYLISGMAFPDQPSLYTAPLVQGALLPVGSTFLLVWGSPPSSVTQTVLASGTILPAFTFALSSGHIVTSRVLVASSLTGGVFQATFTLLAPLSVS